MTGSLRNPWHSAAGGITEGKSAVLVLSQGPQVCGCGCALMCMHVPTKGTGTCIAQRTEQEQLNVCLPINVNVSGWCVVAGEPVSILWLMSSWHLQIWFTPAPGNSMWHNVALNEFRLLQSILTLHVGILGEVLLILEHTNWSVVGVFNK